MAAEPVAILDACVLVQASLRDTLLRLAEPPSLYQPLWSEEITVEMKRALERQIGLSPHKTAYLERELRRHFPEFWVAGFEPLVHKMTNDETDEKARSLWNGYLRDASGERPTTCSTRRSFSVRTASISRKR